MANYIIVNKHQVNLIGIYEDTKNEYLITEGCSFINPEYGTKEYYEALINAIKLAQSYLY